MSGKALSNGTLSLRFMQNAHRAKQQAAVELEQAKVKDEAEWEVSKEVRDAWGMASNSHSGQTVTYEASYIPFMFSSTDNDGLSERNIAGPSRLGAVGRRTFGKGGKEVIASAADTYIKPLSFPQDFPDGQHPTSLSSIVDPLSDSKTHKMQSDKKSHNKAGTPGSVKSSVPVLSMMTDTAVGVDVRSARRSTAGASSTATRSIKKEIDPKPLFVRPSGVDGPVTPRITEHTKRKRVDSLATPDTTEGTRSEIVSTGATAVPDAGLRANSSRGDDEGPARDKAKKAKKKKGTA